MTDPDHIPMKWEEETEKKFNIVLEQIPALIRGVAETLVIKEAVRMVREDNRQPVEEKDLGAPFFSETPAGFRKDMIRSLEELGVDYKAYGFNAE
ncbi:MAG: hypothetical protein KC897_01615 [Candidatus Omnitrophica bacterium]|nr:hypothetical protein [Candidatus Omnitrophota bacterium]